jgi:hypothetical protein
VEVDERGVLFGDEEEVEGVFGGDGPRRNYQQFRAC